MRCSLRILLLGALALMLTAGAQAQDFNNVDLNGRWAYGPVSAMATLTEGGDDFACVAYGAYLEFYDVSNTGTADDPTFMERLELDKPLLAMYVFYVGADAYVLGVDGWGVRVIKANDPSDGTLDPDVVASLETTGWAHDVAGDEDYAFVADGAQGLRVVDLSTPASPVLETYYFNGGGISRTVAFDGTNIFVGCTDADNVDNNIIRKFTHTPGVTSPLDQVATYTGCNYPLDIAVGTFDDTNATTYNGLFVADSSRVLVLDADNPITLLGSVDVATGIADVVTGNSDAHQLYVGIRGTTNNLEQYDLNSEDFDGVPTPLPITLAAAVYTQATGGILQDLSYYSAGATVYAANGYGAAIPYSSLDITDNASAWLTTFKADPVAGYLQDVVVDGNFAFVADGDDGLRRFDVTDPAAIAQTHLETADFAACVAYGVATDGTTVWVASGSEGLKAYAAADLSAGATFDTGGKAYGVDYYDGYVYVADGNGGLRIFDATNITTEVGSYTLPDVSYKAVDVKVWEDQVNAIKYAFVAVEQVGLWIINVTTPATPALVTNLAMAGGVFAVDVNVLGHYAYVADGVDGLRVVDIRTKSAPTIVGTLNTAGSALDVKVNGSYAYVADGTSGFRVVLVSEPTNPTEVGYYDTGDQANGLFIVDNENIFVTDRDGGLYSFDNLLAHFNHFLDTDPNYIPPSGRSIPVVINSATINGVTLQANDEVAILDNQGGVLKIVGRGIFQGTFPFVIQVWMQYVEAQSGTTVPGAISGQPMIFKIWDRSAAAEVGGFPTYTRGTGTFDETELMTLVGSLTGTDLTHYNIVAPTGVFVNVHIDNNITYNGNSINVGDEIAVVDTDQADLVVGGAIYQGAALDIPVWMERDNGLPGAQATSTVGFKAYLEVYAKEFVARPTYLGGATTDDFNGDVYVTELRMYETNQTQAITLEEEKLNLISFNVDPAVYGGDTPVSEMLGDIRADATALCQDDQGNVYIAGSGIDNIGYVDFTKGYYVYWNSAGSNPDETITNNGYRVNASDYSRALSGLQMIGYPYEATHWAQHVFASINTAQTLMVIEDDQGTFWIKDGDNGLNLNYFDYYGGTGLQPGKGYKMYVRTPMTYTYPAANTLSGTTQKRLPATHAEYAMVEPVHFTFKETGMPYAVVLTGSTASLEVGDEIGLYDNGICVGAAVYQGVFPMLVAAWKGVDNAQMTLPGYTEGHPIQAKVWQAGAEADLTVKDGQGQVPVYGGNLYAACAVTGVSTGVDDGDTRPTTFGLDANYPNPFNPDTWIQYHVPKTSTVTLTIYNSRGQVVKVLLDEKIEAGVHQVQWNGRDEHGQKVASGVYLVTMEAGSFKATHKMMLLQ